MKEKWRTLLQAMMLPAIYVCIFLLLFALPIIQAYQEMRGDMDSQSSIGSMQMGNYNMWNDPTFVPVLFFLIVHPVVVFVFLTIVLYFVIGFLKKRKKKQSF